MLSMGPPQKKRRISGKVSNTSYPMRTAPDVAAPDVAAPVVAAPVVAAPVGAAPVGDSVGEDSVVKFTKLPVRLVHRQHPLDKKAAYLLHKDKWCGACSEKRSVAYMTS